MSSRRQLYALGEPFGDSCTRIEGHRRILGGGGGGSSSSSSTATTTQNTDKRQVVDNSSIGVSSDSSTVNVNYTDQGAVNQAVDLVRSAGAGALDAYKSLLAATLALDSKNTETLQANTDLASQLVSSSAISGAGSAIKLDDKQKQVVIYGALAIAGIYAIKAMGK